MHFNFHQYLGNPEFDERGRLVNKVMLNKEWTILCVWRCKNGGGWNSVVESVEIHRKNTAGKFLVIGDLLFKPPEYSLRNKQLRDKPEKCMNIAELIENRSSFKVIWSNLNIDVPVQIHVSLKISKVEEEQPTNLTSEESKERIQLNSFEELSKDLERLLNPESSLADVKLKCDSVYIPAHKLILSARCPVFASMFAHTMLESLTNEVDISDISVSTLQALLMHIYTGRTSDLTASSAADLLFAADKYHLQDLMAVCTHFLKETMSNENMWDILVLGDMHSEDLKAFAVDYIRNKSGEFSELRNASKWKALREERPQLAMDLLESLVSNRDG